MSALDFDLSVFDIFGALSFGAAVVLPDEEERRDASAWRELVSSRCFRYAKSEHIAE